MTLPYNMYNYKPINLAIQTVCLRDNVRIAKWRSDMGTYVYRYSALDGMYVITYA